LLLRCVGTFSFLGTLCQLEIDNTSDVNILFRGNSLTTCTLDYYMKECTIETSNYLADTLGGIIESIFDSRLSCEVDPLRVLYGDPREVANGCQRLESICTATFEAICESMARLPVQLKRLFGALQAAVMAKFDSGSARQVNMEIIFKKNLNCAAVPSVIDRIPFTFECCTADPSPPSPHNTTPALARGAQSAVAGFLFLRLLCPAILGPHLFKICTQVPEGEVARTLLLVSKCIQVGDSQDLSSDWPRW